MSLREILAKDLPIQDFSDEPKGRRDAMKGMFLFVAGIGGFSLFAPHDINEGFISLIIGTSLFLGYSVKGIGRMIYNDIKGYHQIPEVSK